MLFSQPAVPVKTYRFYFSADSAIRLSRFPGSAWRGAFGHSLKKTVCVVRNTPCKECMLKSACAYSYVFETPPPADTEKMRKYTAAPHPFVLQFPLPEPTSGTLYRLDIILFGHGQRYFPYIIHALQTAGRDGVGGHQQLYTLQKITDIDFQGIDRLVYQNGELKPQQQADSPEIPPMPGQIEIIFHTPLRIKQDNKNIASRQFTFGVFFGTLLRRISLISYFHTDTPLETNFAGLTTRARAIQFSKTQLHWYDWTRYSSRQQTEMNMGGLTGSATLDMQGLEDFWPYLWLGQWTHVGKGTSMGMGAYTIQPTSLPNA
jgi:hypothetical protein